MPRPAFKAPDPNPDRPAIWAEGRQQPRFNALAFLNVGQAMARLWLVPLMDRTAVWLTGQGTQIAAGRYCINLSWLGRAERFVPSRLKVGGVVGGLALRVTEARGILQPIPEPVEAFVLPEQRVQVQRPKPAADPALAAIRAAIHTKEPEAAPAQPVLTAKAPPGFVRKLLALAAAHLIAWSSLALALPVGLFRAVVYHLDGGDLTTWS